MIWFCYYNHFRHMRLVIFFIKNLPKNEWLNKNSNCNICSSTSIKLYPYSFTFISSTHFIIQHNSELNITKISNFKHLPDISFMLIFSIFEFRWVFCQACYTFSIFRLCMCVCYHCFTSSLFKPFGTHVFTYGYLVSLNHFVYSLR